MSIRTKVKEIISSDEKTFQKKGAYSLGAPFAHTYLEIKNLKYRPRLNTIGGITNNLNLGLV